MHIKNYLSTVDTPLRQRYVSRISRGAIPTVASVDIVEDIIYITVYMEFQPTTMFVVQSNSSLLSFEVILYQRLFRNGLRQLFLFSNTTSTYLRSHFDHSGISYSIAEFDLRGIQMTTLGENDFTRYSFPGVFITPIDVFFQISRVLFWDGQYLLQYHNGREGNQFGPGAFYHSDRKEILLSTAVIPFEECENSYNNNLVVEEFVILGPSIIAMGKPHT